MNKIEARYYKFWKFWKEQINFSIAHSFKIIEIRKDKETDRRKVRRIRAETPRNKKI